MRNLKGLFVRSGFPARLFLFFFAFLFCFLVGLLVGMELFGESMTLDLPSFKLLQLVQSAFSFLLPPLLFAYLCSDKPTRYLCLDKAPDGRQALLVVPVMVAAIPLINLLARLNNLITFPAFLSDVEELLRVMEQQAALHTDRLLYTTTWGGLAVNLLVVAVLPAVGEELFFRGALQRLFAECRPGAWTVWLAAFVFSAIHMQFFGFVPRLLMGAFFGYLLLWSGSIWLPVIAHFTNNALVVVFRFLTDNGYLSVDPDQIGTGPTWWLGVLAVPVCAVLIGRLAGKRKTADTCKTRQDITL